MKTKEEIKDELTELYGANIALNEVMEYLHSKRMDLTRKMFALKNMLNEMDDGDKNETY